ncbi:hypothetical protein, partial [Streptomyces sp. 8L]|uniref:hypothetical protein n=1 Tax=Streptomyces sp. 8L TaxID=2877242 RepID=UPI001CD70AF0
TMNRPATLPPLDIHPGQASKYCWSTKFEDPVRLGNQPGMSGFARLFAVTKDFRALSLISSAVSE